jgi:molybdopterin-containing oxidoreductase family membrane subunit
MAKVMLASGLIVAYGYLMEGFVAWYTGHPLETYIFANRFYGPYATLYWLLLVCNVLVPQILWFRFSRKSTIVLFVVAILVNVGMWLERFIIVVGSLHRDHLPSSWDMFYPTFWDWAMFAGTIGLFTSLLFLFIRLLPMISISEMRELVAHEEHSAE